MTEISSAEKDRDLSFSIINYLSASIKGKIAGLTLLGQLKSEKFELADLEKAHSNNEKVNIWFEGCLNGETLFTASWSTPETFEAQSALSMLAKIKPDLSELAASIEALTNGQQAINISAVQLIFSALIRSAYSRDTYIRGFLTYGQAFNKPENIQIYSPLLAGSEERIFSINQGLELFKATNFDLEKLGADFLSTLLALADDLPAVFRTQIHDLNLLGSNYKGGITPENLGFSEEEVRIWEEAGVGLNTAGYWRAYSFSAEECINWANAGANDPGTAFGWQLSKFDPKSARGWIEQGIPPVAAKLWGEAGLTPIKAREQLEQGYIAPNQPNPNLMTKPEE